MSAALSIEKQLVVSKENTECCGFCYEPCDPDACGEMMWHTYETRRYVRVTMRPLCNTCAPHYEAILEAQDEGRRFTKLSPPSERCVCGNLASEACLQRTGWCVPCQRQWRMLHYQIAEVKMARAMIREARKQLRKMA